jgi:hypothetical protein
MAIKSDAAKDSARTPHDFSVDGDVITTAKYTCSKAALELMF